jgi:hypothetical protein
MRRIEDTRIVNTGATCARHSEITTGACETEITERLSANIVRTCEMPAANTFKMYDVTGMAGITIGITDAFTGRSRCGPITTDGSIVVIKPDPFVIGRPRS